MQAELTLGHRNRSTGLAERLIVSQAARIAAGHLTLHRHDGAAVDFQGAEPGPHAEIQIRHPRVFRRLLSGGDLALAEAYMDGDWDSPDLTALLELGALNEARLKDALGGRTWARAARRLAHVLRRNSKRGARRNIAAHYDLGNEFYAEWLDPTLTYSAGLFAGADDGLVEAQIRKYRRIAAHAGIRPGHRVLEIGCGWGGFSVWAAREIACHVTAITISQQQYAHAVKRVRDAGLEDRVEVRLQDYRDVIGSFDSIVSIEMLEAVGEAYWPTYFDALNARLKPGGRAALQVITIDDAHFDAYRRDADFVQRYVFPGGMLPSKEVLRRQAAQAGLAWQRAEAYGADYARTLAIWHRRFDEVWPRIKAQGFDERFRLLWKYYLSYCEAGFRIGRIDVLQIAMSRGAPPSQ